eukprot:1583488-Rhodomonas_salina.1
MGSLAGPGGHYFRVIMIIRAGPGNGGGRGPGPPAAGRVPLGGRSRQCTVTQASRPSRRSPVPGRGLGASEVDATSTVTPGPAGPTVTVTANCRPGRLISGDRDRPGTTVTGSRQSETRSRSRNCQWVTAGGAHTVTQAVTTLGNGVCT